MLTSSFGVRLISRLPRILYPASTRLDHFDHEANIARVASLEARLTSNQRSIALLRAQLKEEEIRAREDEEEVEHLTESLGSNRAFRRQQARTLHSVAKQYLEGTEKHVEDPNGTTQEAAKKMSSDVSMNELAKDNDLMPVLNQLQDHLRSIQVNVDSVSKLKQEMDAAWRDLLCAPRHTSPDMVPTTHNT